MKKNKDKSLLFGGVMLSLFALWTLLVVMVDVQPVGVNGTGIGFAGLNCWFHSVTGVNLQLYYITDWLSIIPFLICSCFALVGFCQLIKRKSLIRVDVDIILLGVYYSMVIFCYVAFEIIPINYRPVLINGVMEVSYPSSTTLLVLAVMPTLTFYCKRNMKSATIFKIIRFSTTLFSFVMVMARLISGVHWLTDIVGGILLSSGLFNIYKGIFVLYDRQKLKGNKNGIL